MEIDAVVERLNKAVSDSEAERRKRRRKCIPAIQPYPGNPPRFNIAGQWIATTQAHGDGQPPNNSTITFTQQREKVTGTGENITFPGVSVKITGYVYAHKFRFFNTVYFQGIELLQQVIQGTLNMNDTLMMAGTFEGLCTPEMERVTGTFTAYRV